MKPHTTTRSLLLALLAAMGLAAAPSLSAAESGWWNPSWTNRRALIIDPAADATMTEGTGPVTVPVRLSDNNFDFSMAAQDGSDLRFVSEDGKTTYPSQVEKWDFSLHEAIVWVKLPAIQTGGKTSLFVYYGNAAPGAASKPGEAYDADSALVWHFAGAGSAAPVDSTSNGCEATAPATMTDSGVMGSGVSLLGAAPLVIKENPALAWTGAMTASMWLNPYAASLSGTSVVLSRGEGGESFRLLLQNGAPVVEVGAMKTSPGQPIAASVWTHVAVTVEAGSVKLFVDGKLYGTTQAALPALQGPITIGGPASGGATAFTGVIDELGFAKVARSAGWVHFAAVSQGTGEAQAKLISTGVMEASGGTGKAAEESELMQQIGLFGDIAHNMKFDGWIAIGLCVLMIATGWTVAVRKFIYLNSTQKGSDQFLRQWKLLSADLTALDYEDADSVRSFGGTADPKIQRLVQKSPLYEIYHIGSEEIRHRLARDKERTQGLSGRSIQAIRAALDGGMVHATHKLTKGLIFLTISIAGGPYVGLLGTVVGVMVTFAIIARNHEVDVNSIAPGIASALLATVAGLVVAIPALFMYSYLNSRIKEISGSMQVFIDEFVSKMAEFYPPKGEVSPYAPSNDRAA